MRHNFVEFIEARAKADPHFVLITADLGYGIFDQFRAEFPDQFINVGVAEQNLIGMATGMAMVGMNPLCYSLGNFPTMRCLEQIRNDAAYHDARITIVSSGGGFGYGQLGMSHHSTEDIGIMRPIPNTQIFVPATSAETIAICDQYFDADGVKYIRLEKSGPDLTALNPSPLEDGFYSYAKGEDLLLIGSGSIISECMGAAEALLHHDIHSSVISLSHVKSANPAHRQALQDMARAHKLVITVEEHNIIGGIGSVMAEILAESDGQTKLKRLGMPDQFTTVVGDQAFLRGKYGLDEAAICTAATTYFQTSSKK